MSHKWDDNREKRLLVEVISFTNPKVERSAWAGIAANMGEGATAEACRQKFQGIKRNLNTAAASDSSSKPTTPKAASKALKPKTPASTSTATKGRKRKADEAIANEDDNDSDEVNLPAPKSQKVKKENNANGTNAELFKVEKEGEGVDLVHDDLYSDSAA